MIRVRSDRDSLIAAAAGFTRQDLPKRPHSLQHRRVRCPALDWTNTRVPCQPNPLDFLYEARTGNLQRRAILLQLRIVVIRGVEGIAQKPDVRNLQCLESLQT